MAMHVAHRVDDEEIAAALDATDQAVSVGGAGLAAQAIELGLVDELCVFRYPVVVGGGTPFLPPVTNDIAHHRPRSSSATAPSTKPAPTNAPAQSGSSSTVAPIAAPTSGVT